MEYTEDQLTGWFNFSEKRPDSPGVYEIKNPDFRLFSYWDGSSWHWGDFQPSKCNIDDPMISYHEENLRKFWRGLASDPSAPKKRAGNKRKTMYVVFESNYAKTKKVGVGCYSVKKNAQIKAESVPYGFVQTVRFRTPEA